MAISEMLLGELEHETGTTRKFLTRLPDRLDWRPHERSMTLGALASHIADMHGWGGMILDQDRLDLTPPFNPWLGESPRAILERFDEGVGKLRQGLTGYSDERMGQTWTMTMGGQTMIAQPRIAVLRTMIIKHIVHHRAQLGVYYRLLDVPVPATYGPSADEQA